MAKGKTDAENFPIRMEGTYSDDSLVLIGAVVEEGLSTLTRTTVEFTCSDKALDMNTLLGTKMRVVLDPPGGPKRLFPGTCVSVEYLDTHSASAHFSAEVRPWLWFLTRNTDCRVFQSKTVVDIIKDVLGVYGFTNELETKLSGDHEVRDYVVQYRETDYAFLCRLMEEEGIFFWFTVDGDTEKMVLGDDVGAYSPVEGESKLPFRYQGDVGVGVPHVRAWTSARRATTGKVTLKDYDFTRPKAEMQPSSELPKGSFTHNKREFYDYPGHYRVDKLGDVRARIRMEAEAVRHETSSGVATATNLGVGRTFSLSEHPRETEIASYLVTSARHRFQPVGTDFPPRVLAQPDFDFGDSSDPYQVAFTSIPAAMQYRAPLDTPWPEISGVHTAVVVGKKGEEIWTDNYGRIKVQFHWDRKGKMDENSSCWVRTMMPWSGKNWGMIAIPRMGQEVVVQFEEGDPDRPLVIGMLYNADFMPPFALPANGTQSGLKTNSSKGGAGFSELMFEDKKDNELVRFQAERDYEQIVKNNATIKVGHGHKDKGDMDLTVHRNLTETLDTGDHTFKIAKGSQKIDIKTDKTETIEGKSTLTVTGDVAETVKTGNYSLNAKAGKIDASAMQSITLKCGGSSIKIDPSGVTIKGPMIKIQADGMIQMKGSMTQVQAQLLVLKGSLTTIN